MKDGDSSHARIAAANALLDRAWGKATQPIDYDPPPNAQSVEERAELARAAIAEAFAEVEREREER
jgi:hypothetical protein